MVEKCGETPPPACHSLRFGYDVPQMGQLSLYSFRQTLINKVSQEYTGYILMAKKILVSFPEKFLEEIDARAAEEQRSRSELIREALRTYLDSHKDRKVGEQSIGYAVRKSKPKAKKPFPDIEIVKFTGGMSAVIRGTRVKVSHIVGYLQAGETPETIANEILPHITLSQVYEAMHYYFVHKAEIDKEREENTEEVSRNLLRKRIGAKKYREITGG
jgi:uncharacterized protein (DUF433 family)